MFSLLKKIYKKILKPLFSIPLLVEFLLEREIGKDYNFGIYKKIKLIRKIKRNIKKVQTLSHWLEHLEMAATILKIPPHVKGDVIECGCYKGGSTVNLSIVCSAVGRNLIVCDSFRGLPKPDENDKVHHNVHVDHCDEYEEGRFSATLDEVKDNLNKYGHLDICEFVVGYFEDTLKELNKQYVMAFLDIDLVQSLKPCLLEIWPNLQDKCYLYLHEARSINLVFPFFDKEWWNNNLNSEPPGFIGAGTGLPLQIVSGSEIGYAIKSNV